MSDPVAPVAFEMVRRPPSQRTAGLISVMSGYREMAGGRFSQREAAPLTVPLIISFGTPFTIALGREPDATGRQRSFAAGLYAGAVYIESDGGAECVQVDFTPLGAFRFFGSAMVDLAARMIDIDDVLGSDGTRASASAPPPRRRHRSRRAARQGEGLRRQDRDGAAQHRLRQPRFRLPRPGRQSLEFWHLLAEGDREAGGGVVFFGLSDQRARRFETRGGAALLTVRE